MRQQENESVDQFCTRLRQKAERCEFTNKEDEITSQIIQGCTSRKKKECRNYGGEFPHQSQCLAFGKTCNYCHKRTHFVKVCRKKANAHQGQIREIQQSGESDQE